MRYILFLILTLFMTCNILWAQTATPPAGSGTQADPYQIATLDNLYWMTQNSSSWSSYFIQTAFIDAEATVTWDNGAGLLPIGEFFGSYDGQNYSISGLYINRIVDEVALFNRVNGGTLKNIHLTGADITGFNDVGALAAIVYAGATVSNCSSTGQVTSTGGVGYTSGGLFGQISNAGTTVSNSYSSCTVNSGGYEVGGFAGAISQDASISNCYSTGNVTGSNKVGGFTGMVDNSAIISNCYATGSVTRNTAEVLTDFGAFTGVNGDPGGTISNSYATGAVTYSGDPDPTDKGFSGSNGTSGVVYTNNFFDSQTTGQSSDAAGGGTAKTTVEMQDVATFTNVSGSAGLSSPVWDFVTNPYDDSANNDYWDMDQAGTVNNGYPILSWQQGADQTLPVNLAAFSALPGDGQVTLKWTTASEVNNKAFLLERSGDGEQFTLITRIEGQGNKNSRTDYSYTDEAVFNGNTYHYRLSDMDYNGKITQLQTVAVTPQTAVDGKEAQTISGFALYPAYPNPFNPQTTFGFDLPERSAVSLTVFDLNGNKVRELVNGTRESGIYRVVFSGNELASGVYFYRFTARGLASGKMFSQSRRVMLIK